MNTVGLKRWIDDYFFMSTEQQEDEGVEIGGSTYGWVLMYIVAAAFGLFIAIQAFVQLH